MSVIGDQKSEPSSAKKNAVKFNSTHSVSRELDSLSTASNSESIAEGFAIGIHTTKHDFDNHLKIGIFEGVDSSDSLAELTEKTATHDQLSHMTGSTFSRRTNDRAIVAVVPVLFELLHTAQSLHSTQQVSASPDQSPLPVNSVKTQLFTSSSQLTVGSNSTSLRA